MSDSSPGTSEAAARGGRTGNAAAQWVESNVIIEQVRATRMHRNKSTEVFCRLSGEAKKKNHCKLFAASPHTHIAPPHHHHPPNPDRGLKERFVGSRGTTHLWEPFGSLPGQAGPWIGKGGGRGPHLAGLWGWPRRAHLGKAGGCFASGEGVEGQMLRLGGGEGLLPSPPSPVPRRSTGALRRAEGGCWGG